MTFIERRICRLLDRPGNLTGSVAGGAVTVCRSSTQNPDDETTAGGALSGTERLLDHDTSCPPTAYATRLITPSPAGARQVPRTDDAVIPARVIVRPIRTRTRRPGRWRAPCRPVDPGPVGGGLVRSLRTTATDDARGLKQAEVVAHFPKQPDIVGHPIDR